MPFSFVLKFAEDVQRFVQNVQHSTAKSAVTFANVAALAVVLANL